MYARIYSNKFNNIILWEGEIPDGKIYLNVKTTDDNIDSLYNKIVSENCTCDPEDSESHSYCEISAWENLWSDERLNNCYDWISDPQDAIDSEKYTLEWDSDDGFDFPEWFPEWAEEKYSLLDQYNRSYGLEIADLNNEGYLVYAQLCRLIEKQTPGLRFKNEGPYNPENKKPILSALEIGYDGKILDYSSSNRWQKIAMDESETLRAICKKFSLKYPWRWEYNRKNVIESAASKMAEKPVLELRGLNEAIKTNAKKIDDLKLQLAEFESEQTRLNELIPLKQAEIESAKIESEKWKNEQLSK
jgi:hypothetical protein